MTLPTGNPKPLQATSPSNPWSLNPTPPPFTNQAGYVRLCGQSPSEISIPCWRAQVMYVHQSRVNFKGTPNDFYKLVQGFAAQQGRPRGDLAALVHDLGLDPAVLDQGWSELSVRGCTSTYAACLSYLWIACQTSNNRCTVSTHCAFCATVRTKWWYWARHRMEALASEF